jgi:prephenate dehydratase
MTVKTSTTASTAGRIAYQGEAGANSHIAAREVHPELEPLACATFEDALAAVKSGEAKFGMIPIENSIAGRVADVHHLLPSAGLHIVGEHFLPIHFQLVAPRGAKLEQICDVYSHVHALGQCRRILRERGIRAHVAGDTAGAARQVAEWGDKTKAALAPRLAAEVYGLDILAEDVEDEAHNTTRFLILANEPDDAEPGDGPVITTFIFRVRNVPAALYKAMGGFATNGVNMTKLESYMVGGRFTATVFYADVEGHPSDPPVQRALEELGFFSSELKVLGVYRASALRKSMVGGRD